jgi:hypothetical protein
MLKVYVYVSEVPIRFIFHRHYAYIIIIHTILDVYSNLEDGYLFFCSKINVRKPDRPIKNELSRATENIGNKTQDEDNTTQKTERMSNADPTK